MIGITRIADRTTKIAQCAHIAAREGSGAGTISGTANPGRANGGCCVANARGAACSVEVRAIRSSAKKRS